MATPTSIPFPRSNQTETGLLASLSAIASTDIIVALGDYVGGAADDLWTLSAHGLVSGDVLHCLGQDTMGAFTGGEGTRGFVKYLSSSTFQLYSDRALSVAIENTADGTAIFLKSRPGHNATAVAKAAIEKIIIGTNIYTGSTVEDMVTPANGMKGALDGDSIKLLYKSAAGAAAVAVNATVYVKAPVVALTAAGYFQTSATAGGAVADTTADGTVVFLKTS